MLHSAKALSGYKMRATNGEVGKVMEVNFDGHFSIARTLFADVDPGLAGKRAQISPCAFRGA